MTNNEIADMITEANENRKKTSKNWTKEKYDTTNKIIDKIRREGVKFITLNRRMVDRNYYDLETDTDECIKLKLEPVTINPKYIISMVEVFDGDKFDYTRIVLVDAAYEVTHHVDEIVKMVNDTEED